MRLAPRLAILIVLLTPVTAHTQSFIDMPGAVWRYHFNEISLDGKASFDDPVKIRMSAGSIINRAQHLGILSFDVCRPDCAAGASRTEKVMIQGNKNRDESGYIAFLVQSPFGVDDRTMRRKLEVYHNLMIAHVPIVAPDGRVLVDPGPQPATPLSPYLGGVYSTDGRFVLVVQNDGNIVMYNTQTNQPTWSLFTGVVR